MSPRNSLTPVNALKTMTLGWYPIGRLEGGGCVPSYDNHLCAFIHWVCPRIDTGPQKKCLARQTQIRLAPQIFSAHIRNQHNRFSEWGNKKYKWIPRDNAMWDGYDTDYGHGRLSTWDTTNMNSYPDILSCVQNTERAKSYKEGQIICSQYCVNWNPLIVGWHELG